MHTWIEIKKAAILNNYKEFQKIVGSTILAPVLKANAYGHGLSEVYTLLKELSPPWLCVNYLEEGALLRELGFKGRILQTGPFSPKDFKSAFHLNLDICISNKENFSKWLAAKEKPNAHIKIDTGLSRQGFSVIEFSNILPQLRENINDIKGIMSHFANVEDVSQQEFANLQLQNFKEAVSFLGKNNPSILRHISSSASTLLMKQSHFDLVRVGISLYGFWPSQLTRLSYFSLKEEDISLKPALSWFTRISMLRRIKSGTYVGYGCTFKASSEMQIAILPLGYFEGYPRVAANNHAYVLCGGLRCPILGRICMNMMIIDVSAVKNVKVGDRVTLIGNCGKELLTAEQLASWSESIQYELVTRLNQEIPRVIVD